MNRHGSIYIYMHIIIPPVNCTYGAAISQDLFELGARCKTWMQFFFYRLPPLYFTSIFCEYFYLCIPGTANKQYTIHYNMEAARILCEIKKVELIFFSSKGMSRLNSSSCSMCAYNVNKSLALFVEKWVFIESD